MTKDVNGMKKRRGRPALGRTRKLTKGVTVKFSPVSYETLRFRAGKSGRSLAVYIREAALAATVTARHTPEENALLRSLAGMANNLNQLTKLSHQTGFYRLMRHSRIPYFCLIIHTTDIIYCMNY